MDDVRCEGDLAPRLPVEIRHTTIVVEISREPSGVPRRAPRHPRRAEPGPTLHAIRRRATARASCRAAARHSWRATSAPGPLRVTRSLTVVSGGGRDRERSPTEIATTDLPRSCRRRRRVSVFHCARLARQADWLRDRPATRAAGLPNCWTACPSAELRPIGRLIARPRVSCCGTDGAEISASRAKRAVRAPITRRWRRRTGRCPRTSCSTTGIVPRRRAHWRAMTRIRASGSGRRAHPHIVTIVAAPPRGPPHLRRARQPRLWLCRVRFGDIELLRSGARRLPLAADDARNRSPRRPGRARIHWNTATPGDLPGGGRAAALVSRSASPSRTRWSRRARLLAARCAPCLARLGGLRACVAVAGRAVPVLARAPRRFRTSRTRSQPSLVFGRESVGLDAQIRAPRGGHSRDPDVRSRAAFAQPVDVGRAGAVRSPSPVGLVSAGARWPAVAKRDGATT
jgi:hypothetical protein